MARTLLQFNRFQDNGAAYPGHGVDLLLEGAPDFVDASAQGGFGKAVVNALGHDEGGGPKTVFRYNYFYDVFPSRMDGLGSITGIFRTGSSVADKRILVSAFDDEPMNSRIFFYTVDNVAALYWGPSGGGEQRVKATTWALFPNTTYKYHIAFSSTGGITGGNRLKIWASEVGSPLVVVAEDLGSYIAREWAHLTPPLPSVISFEKYGLLGLGIDNWYGNSIVADGGWYDQNKVWLWEDQTDLDAISDGLETELDGVAEPVLTPVMDYTTTPPRHPAAWGPLNIMTDPNGKEVMLSEARGAALGVAPLGLDSKVPLENLPPLGGYNPTCVLKIDPNVTEEEGAKYPTLAAAVTWANAQIEYIDPGPPPVYDPALQVFVFDLCPGRHEVPAGITLSGQYSNSCLYVFTGAGQGVTFLDITGDLFVDIGPRQTLFVRMEDMTCTFKLVGLPSYGFTHIYGYIYGYTQERVTWIGEGGTQAHVWKEDLSGDGRGVSNIYSRNCKYIALADPNYVPIPDLGGSGATFVGDDFTLCNCTWRLWLHNLGSSARMVSCFNCLFPSINGLLKLQSYASGYLYLILNGNHFVVGGNEVIQKEAGGSNLTVLMMGGNQNLNRNTVGSTVNAIPSLAPNPSWPDETATLRWLKARAGEDIGYDPGDETKWVDPDPTTLRAALDRIASLVVSLNSGNPIP